MKALCFVLLHWTGALSTDVPVHVNVEHITAIISHADKTIVRTLDGEFVHTRETVPSIFKKIRETCRD